MTTSDVDSGLARSIVAILAVLVLLPVLTMVVMFPMMGWGGGWMMGGRFSGSVSPWWGLGMILIWLVILLGIGYALYRTLLRTPSSEMDSALEELRHSYARGELSDDKFETRRELLGQKR
ncbi:SHOCT domain-containing protein [Haladaptatus sp. DFWS20]|uniref:SHOCT domain-containing protein n=1 Tax=Haladaptatus sp. DFWS20 TaxID=3403467 RepID=UPI003EB6D080